MKAAVIGAGALVVMVVGWMLGLGGAVLRVLPNTCDPGNPRLSAIEAAPVASIEVRGASVSRKFSTPAGGSTRCNDATVEIDLASSDTGATYRSARQKHRGHGMEAFAQRSAQRSDADGVLYQAVQRLGRQPDRRRNRRVDRDPDSS